MALTQTKVSQLYVSLFGRASEGEGNEYWQGTALELDSAADNMLETDAAKEYFGSSLDSNIDFIKFIYENTLNKTYEDDSDGVDYWTNLLESGQTRGEIVSSLISAIDTYSPDGENYNINDTATLNAYKQFNNRVDVSNYTAETVVITPDDYETSLGFNNDLKVDFDKDSIVNSMQNVEILIQSEEYIEAYTSKQSSNGKSYIEQYKNFNFGNYDYSTYVEGDDFKFDSFFDDFEYSDFDYAFEKSDLHNDTDKFFDDKKDEIQEFVNNHRDIHGTLGQYGLSKIFKEYVGEDFPDIDFNDFDFSDFDDSQIEIADYDYNSSEQKWMTDEEMNQYNIDAGLMNDKEHEEDDEEHDGYYPEDDGHDVNHQDEDKFIEDTSLFIA